MTDVRKNNASAKFYENSDDSVIVSIWKIIVFDSVGSKLRLRLSTEEKENLQ